jgi:mono/diheme cytochrome c family protein
MMRTPALAITLFLLAVGAASAQEGALPVPPLQQQVDPATLGDARLQRGWEVYTANCTHCHGPGRGMPGTQSLGVRYGDAMPALLEERTDLTPELVEFFVRNGSGAMAPYRKTEVSDAELADLAAYLSRPRP